MKKHHYVYYSYEEWGRGYIGRRSCDCLPEEDTKYFGSFRDKTFKPTGKTILFVCKTRKEVAEIEIELHTFFDVAVNPQFANMAKATSTRFDVTGVPKTEEHKKKLSEVKIGMFAGEKNPRFGVPHTEETKKKIAEANSGRTLTEEHKKKISEALYGEKNPCYGRTGEKHHLFGVPRTEEWKKAQSERMSGEKNPRFGVSPSEETRKKLSEALSGENHPNYGNTGALNPCSKEVIAIKPDGTQLHFGSGREAARSLEINWGSLGVYLRDGHVLTKGKFKGWRFIYKNSTNF